jgi:hypothetical protein
MVTPHQYHLAHLHDRTAVPGLVPNYQEIILVLYLSVLLKQSRYHQLKYHHICTKNLS